MKTATFFILFLIPIVASAAILRTVTTPTSVDINQPIRVDVTLDTQGENVNAIQGSISFPAGQFELQSIANGASPVSFWVDPPREVSSGTVSFSGIVPGGFTGAASSVVSLVLKPLTSGTAMITIPDVSLLRNDGEGTPISVVTANGSVVVSATIATSSSNQVLSLVGPEEFLPVIGRDQNVYDGKYFLAFSTTDKGSGVDHYEVLEMPTGGGRTVASWQTATSPYELRDQNLSSDIYVRAVDHVGNFIVVKVSAEHPAGVSHAFGIDAIGWWIIFALAAAALLRLIRYVLVS